MENRQKIIFFEKLRDLIAGKQLIRLVLSNQRQRESDLKSVIITLVELKKGERLNVVYRHKTKDVTTNYEVGEALDLVTRLMEEQFFNADLFSAEASLRMLITGTGKVKLRSGSEGIKAEVSFSHDRKKERLIMPGQNIYLRELGVVNSQFEVRHEMNDKYLQINRYIELLEPFLRELELPDGFHVADMGSGKGYLTFALCDYLTRTFAATFRITGVEARPELVKLSNEIAVKAGFDQLSFLRGTIRDAEFSKPDILIALHACDTATDDAIFRGINAGAALIVCAPCCHKQVRKDMKGSDMVKPILRHGILAERQAEILTDTIRALILEAHGYQTSVFEFISTEHTPKNVMIVGKKMAKRPSGKEQEYKRIQLLKEMYGINRHYLEDLFSSRGLH